MDQYRSKALNVSIVFVIAPLRKRTFPITDKAAAFPYSGPCYSLQEFEDLDEITARYIQPMASFARDLLGHKYFQECNGGSKEVETEIWMQLLPLFFRHNVVLLSSLVENGGAAGQDEKREADFYSLLCLSLQRSAREVLTGLSASWQTPVSRTFYLCGDATLINVECKWDCCAGS